VLPFLFPIRLVWMLCFMANVSLLIN
jgi:hypothetical protein